MSAAAPSYQASSGVQMANDTGETASAFHVATENNTVCFKMVRSLQRTQKSGEKQGRLHERWSWNWTHSRSTVLEAYLEIFWKCMRGISLIASVLSLQCNLEAQLHVGALNYYLQRKKQGTIKWHLFWSLKYVSKLPKHPKPTISEQISDFPNHTKTK